MEEEKSSSIFKPFKLIRKEKKQVKLLRKLQGKSQPQLKMNILSAMPDICLSV
jgi:hypothetical protein